MKHLAFYNLLIIGLTLPTKILAAEDALNKSTLHNPLGTSDIRFVIGRIIRALLGFSGAIALLMFVLGGFYWLTSAGKPEQIKKGKDTLIWAVIGLVVIFSAYMLVGLVIDALQKGTVIG